MSEVKEQKESANFAKKNLSMPKESKIFLLYASAGSGHRSACEAVRQSILDLDPKANVTLVDVLQYMPRILSKLYSGGYIFVVSKYPMLWYFIYEIGSDLSDFRPTGFWHRLFYQSLLFRLFGFLKRERPACIISSHFLSSWAAGLYKLKYDNSCHVSTIVTDYGIHPVWISAGQDSVYVATEQLQAELLPFSRHLGTDKIIPTGIPIHPNFAHPKDIIGLKSKFALDPNRYTILVLGGMFASQNIRDILLWLAECRSRIQIVLVAGKHYPIEEEIKEQLIEKNIRYQIFGYIDFMDDIMAVSDLAITKAGALTTSECLSRGVPLVIFKPYPGQEVRNCDYFLEQGVAVRVDQLSGLSFKIDTILQRPGLLEAMKERALKVAQPFASEKIAKDILTVCQDGSCRPPDANEHENDK